MPKKIDYTLTPEELVIIENAMQEHEDRRIRERACIIYLLHLGQNHDEIADQLSISKGKVYWCHKRWRKEGLAGLSDKYRSGRPAAVDETYQNLILEALEKDPQDLGFEFTGWNTPRLLNYLEKTTGMRVHEKTLRTLVTDMGYVYHYKHGLVPGKSQIIYSV